MAVSVSLRTTFEPLFPKFYPPAERVLPVLPRYEPWSRLGTCRNCPQGRRVSLRAAPTKASTPLRETRQLCTTTTVVSGRNLRRCNWPVSQGSSADSPCPGAHPAVQFPSGPLTRQSDPNPALRGNH